MKGWQSFSLLRDSPLPFADPGLTEGISHVKIVSCVPKFSFWLFDGSGGVPLWIRDIPCSKFLFWKTPQSNSDVCNIACTSTKDWVFNFLFIVQSFFPIFKLIAIRYICDNPPIKAGALQGSMSRSWDILTGITRLRSSSTLNGDSYLRPARIFDSTGGPVPAAKK